MFLKGYSLLVIGRNRLVAASSTKNGVMFSASQCTVLSVFYTESRVKIRSMQRALKNTEVAGLESDGPCWSSSAVLLIQASNTEVYSPSSAH